MISRNSDSFAQDILTIKTSDLFDEDWYVKNYTDVAILKMDPVEHYIWLGAKIGRNPSLRFSTNTYLSEYDDVFNASINPLVHYIKWGKQEGRVAFDVKTSTKPSEGAERLAAEVATLKKNLSATTNSPLVLYESHNLKMQGAPSSLFEIASGVHRRGTYQAVLSSNTPGPLSTSYTSVGIKTIVHSISQNRMKDIDTYDNWLSRLTDHYRLLGPAICHINTLQNFHSVIAAKRAGCAVLWNIRESEPPESYYDYLPSHVRELAYSAFDHADAVVFVANSTRHMWEKHWARPTKAFTIHNGISMDRMMSPLYGTSRSNLRTSYGIRETDIVILSVGTVCPRKGQKDLLYALRKLGTDTLSKTVVAIVGLNKSEYASEVRDGFNNLQDVSGLRFIAVDETEDESERRFLSELYLCGDMLAFCSRVESYPRVIIEALEFGLPIVSTPCFGVREQLEDGISGLFYQEGEIDVLARHLQEMIRNKQFRLKLSEGGRRRLMMLNSYDEMLDAYERIYDTII
ncbi:glycosyltransferase family 4 protein [Agrobacterium bohemicum]|uniref:Glycosyl transferase family 1 domain-containing protein n=1 Tax=Agrobacterium bohemicum TaxID=2052828 RepID=A0A135P7K2_9HYPH|nr:glycosyltransferase family 4 protein [Agrobacterium bohemicum]KXG87404.1 hypothetical protein ATO67_19000 [Agrobacterium bohemicum]